MAATPDVHCGADWLVAGLGNPGPSFVGTRHNLGFAVVDALAEHYGLTRWEQQGSCLLLRVPAMLGRHGRGLLVKPQLGINQHGGALLSLMQQLGIPTGQVLVVADDIRAPFGDLRLRAGTSARGHNGLRDIERYLGRDFPRLCLGVGPRPPGQDLGAFVLERFPAAMAPAVGRLLHRATVCCDAFLSWGLATARLHQGRQGPVATLGEP